MSHIGSGFFDKVPWDRLASDGPRLAAKFGQDVHPRPIILTLLVVLLGLSLGLMFVTWTVNAVDRDALRRQQQFASEGLQAIIAQVPKDQESITIWDDSLVRADARDTQWMAENIGEWVGSYFGHDQVYVLGSDNEVIYAMVEGVTVNAAASDEVYDLMRPLADRLRQHVSSVARSHSQDPAALGKLGAIDIGLISGIPSVVSVKPIVPYNPELFQQLGLRYMHVSVLQLDASVLARIADQYALNGLNMLPQGEATDENASVTVKNEKGQVLAHLTWEGDRPASQVLFQLLPILAVAGSAFALLLSWCWSGWHRHTRLSTALEAAEKASEAKSLFLASMSHELRTPLNAIIGYSEILLEDAEDAGATAQANDLRKIQTSGKHLLALVSDILDLSKIEAGNMELDVQAFPVTEFVEEVVQICRPLAEKNRNEFTVLVEEGLGEAVADRTKMRQCLMNLLSNAGKFTSGGRITLQVSKQVSVRGQSLQFAVIDSGIGIAPESLPKLFANFAQADKATSARYGGTGLGLALSQKLCNLMNGHITVASTLGQGSCFTIHLPIGPALFEVVGLRHDELHPLKWVDSRRAA